MVAAARVSPIRVHFFYKVLAMIVGLHLNRRPSHVTWNPKPLNNLHFLFFFYYNSVFPRFDSSHYD